MTDRALLRTEPLTARNAGFLRQGAELISRLTPGQYEVTPRHFHRGGVGAHVRHILDHYDCFLRGVESGRVDYDQRERDLSVATDPVVAARKLEQVIAALERLTESDGSRLLDVAIDRGGEQTDAPHWGVSSVARELQFLVSHTVHHYAVIAAMLRPQGIEPGSDFGVAPSTLEYEQGVACVR